MRKTRVKNLSRIWWGFLLLVGSAPFCFALVTGVQSWRSEGWILSDWIAWNVLFTMIFWPVLLGGLLLMGFAGFKLWETGQKR